MKKKLIAFTALVTLSFPGICSAIPPYPGPYMSGFLGASFQTNTDVTSTTYGQGATTFNDRVEFDPGVNVGGAGGFDFGYMRIEGELSYKSGEMSKITERTTGSSFANVDGRIGALAAMFNAFVDLHNDTPITPYFGGGVGFATIYLDDTYGTETATGQRSRLYRSDNDTVFAYQAGAGLEIGLTRRLSLDLGYRYFGTSKAKFNNHSSTTSEVKLQSHNASVGLRIKF